MTLRRAVVLGAEGLIGSYVREALLADGWTVAGVSRREPAFEHQNYTPIRTDLTDPTDVQSSMEAFPSATHIFYAGFAWTDTKAEEVAVNTAMLVNGVEGVEAHSDTLEHVCLFEGGKWYGCHIGPFKTPAYEDDPRVMPPIFYYNQEDYLRHRRSEGSRWTWSALRPEGVGGVAIGTPQNFLMILVVYATICKELGIPLRFPGAPECRDALYEMTDARLLAQAALHCATTELCEDEAFNVTNGDSFRWGQMFAYVADLLDMEYAGTQTMSLVEMMSDKEPVWANMVKEHGLAEFRVEDLAFWPAGDNIFNQKWDNVRSSIKLRSTGFQQSIDSRQMVRDVVQKMVDLNLIPSIRSKA